MTETAVVFGGPSPEHDVSILTGLQAARALSNAGAAGKELHSIYWSKSGDWFEVAHDVEAASFLDGVPRGARPLELTAGPPGFSTKPGALGKRRSLEISTVVNCCHGGPGEDGSLQAVLDLAGIGYTGPSVASAAICMDKVATAAIVAAEGLPALPRRLLNRQTAELDFPGPYIVKPRFGGSSIGIDVVADLPTALARLSANPHLRNGAVIEPYRADLYDLQIAVRTWPNLQLSAIERPLRAGAGQASSAAGAAGSEILGYADKYVGGEGMLTAPRELPANIPAGLADEIASAARTLAIAVGVRGVARIDFLSDGNQVLLNEVNTVPGSLARHLWIDPVIDLVGLLGDMLEEASKRPSVAFSTVGADGTVLSAAGAIASKLA
jgi:D-alanine-D-alanine ligase